MNKKFPSFQSRLPNLEGWEILCSYTSRLLNTVVFHRKCSMLQLKLLWFNLNSDLLAKTYSFNPIKNGLNILYNLSKSRFIFPMIQSRFFISVSQDRWCLGFIARAVFNEKIDTFAAHTTNLDFTAHLSWAYPTFKSTMNNSISKCKWRAFNVESVSLRTLQGLVIGTMLIPHLAKNSFNIVSNAQFELLDLATPKILGSPKD